MSDPSYLINSLPVDQALGVRLGKATLWRPAVSVRRTVVTIPGVQGSTPVPGPLIMDEPQLILDCWVLVSSQAELEAKVDHLQALLSQPTVTLTRISGGLSASAGASLVSISPDEFYPGSGARLTIILAIPKVFFRGAEQASAAYRWASDQQFEIPHLNGSSGPVLDATFRVAGPVSSVHITCPVCGTGLWWDGDPVPVGANLFLRRDGGAGGMGAWLNTNPDQWSWSGTNVSDGLSWPGAGRLQLCPTIRSATDRRMLVNVTGGGRSAATTFTVLGRPSYL